MSTEPFPLGKVPLDVLEAILQRHKPRDPRVVVGPGIGEDAAVLDIGERYLVAKTDPITFATDEIGWYVVHVNANDIATTGATPAWFMATLLLPEGRADRAMVETIFDQIGAACDALDISLVGGHSEITYDLSRPIVVGTMFGLVEKGDLVTTGGTQPGDILIVTKGVPIEATAIIARERGSDLEGIVSHALLERCANFLHEPGISVVEDARIALRSGRVHAMHDPTEGGLATGLWEMAYAAGRRLVVDPTPAIVEEGRRLCAATGLDPLGAIASGALLMAVHPDDAQAIRRALEREGIPAHLIGRFEDGPSAVVDVSEGRERPLLQPERDEIARLFE
jgi:hydrogenase expression/formation protein HypE